MAELGSAELGSAKLESVDLGSAKLGSADLGSAKLGSADLGSAELGSAELGSAELLGYVNHIKFVFCCHFWTSKMTARLYIDANKGVLKSLPNSYFSVIFGHRK